MKKSIQFIKSLFHNTALAIGVVFLYEIGLATSMFISLILRGGQLTSADFLLRFDAFNGVSLLLIPVLFLLFLLSYIISKFAKNHEWALSDGWVVLISLCMLITSVIIGGSISFVILVPILWDKAISLESIKVTMLSTNSEILSDGLLISLAYKKINILLSQYGISKLQASVIYFLGFMLSFSNIISNIEGSIGFFERMTGKKTN